MARASAREPSPSVGDRAFGSLSAAGKNSASPPGSKRCRPARRRRRIACKTSTTTRATPSPIAPPCRMDALGVDGHEARHGPSKPSAAQARTGWEGRWRRTATPKALTAKTWRVTINQGSDSSRSNSSHSASLAMPRNQCSALRRLRLPCCSAEGHFAWTGGRYGSLCDAQGTRPPGRRAGSSGARKAR